MRSRIAEQQCPGMDKFGGRGLAAARQRFQLAAFFFGEGNSISGCHPPIIHQQNDGRQDAKYNMLQHTSAKCKVSGAGAWQVA